MMFIAMNETYNLTINGDGSQLNKELETILTNLKAIEGQNMSKPLKDYESKIKRAVELNKELQKVMSKNKDNNIVSSKDMSSSLQKTQEMTQHMKDLQKALKDVQKTGLSKGIKADYDTLHQTINGLNGTMSQTIKQQREFNGMKTTRDPNVQAMIKDWERLGKMPKEYQKSANSISDIKEKNKTLNKQRNRITSANEREQRDGKYSARDGAEVAKALNQDYDAYKKELQKSEKSLKDLRKRQDAIAKDQEKTNNNLSENKINIEQHRERTATNTSISGQYDKEIKELEKYVSNLKNTVSDLGEGGATRDQFESGKVARSRDTFLGTTIERAPSIASHATMGMMGAYGLQYAQGKSSLEGIRGQEIALGQQTGASDYSSLRKNLFEASDERGLGFKPSELVDMSSQAMQAMGDKGLPKQEEITTELATGARGLGIADTDSYMQSMSDIMHSGGIDNDIDLKQFQKTVSGGIKESGMKAQADEQLKALSSMSNTMGAQRELTKNDLNTIAGLQGTFAESGNKSLQGEKGANALNQIQQGIAGAYQDPGQRNIMGFGSEYTGISGAWQQRQDLEDPSKLGENLSKVMGFYGTATPDAEGATGMALMDNYGLSAEQSKEIMKLYDKGELSEKELGEKIKSYQDSSEVDKNAKDQSEQQQGKENQNQARQEKQSQALYESIGALRNFQGMLAGLNPVVYQAMIAIESLAASAASSAAMMGGAYGMKRAGSAAGRRGSSMTRGRAGKQGGKSNKGTGNAGTKGTPAGKQRANKTGGKTTGTGNTGKKSGKSGIIDGSMMSGMFMGNMMGGGLAGDTEGTGKKGGKLGKLGKLGKFGSRFAGYGMMMPMMMGGMMGGSDEEGGSSMGSGMSMMAQMMAIDALMSGGLGKIGSLGKKGIGKGKDIFSKGKADYKKGGASRLGKRAKYKFLRGDKALRGFPNMAKGKIGDLAKSEKVGKAESVLGKGFDKTKDFTKKGLGKVSNFGGQSATGTMTSMLDKGKKGFGKMKDNSKIGKGLGVGKNMLKKAGWVGAGVSALDIGSSLVAGDQEDTSQKFGDTIGGIVDPLGLGYGDGIKESAKGMSDRAQDSKVLFGKGGLIDFSWSNGKDKGEDKRKGGFQDSPVGKAWNGITSFFGGGDESKGGGGGGGQDFTDKAGTSGTLTGFVGQGKENDVKGSDNKKKKMTAEELRQKNNKSESENLNMFKNLLTRWEQSIQEAKGLDTEGGGDSDSGDLGSGEGSDKKKSPDAWKAEIKKAAKAMGIDISDSDVNGIASLIKNESGGDPKIQQQIQDVNSGGNEAQGLLQYVPSTFDAYKVKGHDDIHNGYDQLLAFFNNKNWKQDYNPNGGWGPTGGKRKGGGGGRDWDTEPVETPQEEPYKTRAFATMRAQQSSSTATPTNNTANVSVNISINGSDRPNDTAQAVKDKLDSYFNTDDFSIFQNNHRRT